MHNMKNGELCGRHDGHNGQHYSPEAHERRNAAARAYGREYIADHRDEVNARSREWNATKAHGITRAERDWMYEEQGRACAGCFTPMADSDLEIDHDHGCCSGTYSCGQCIRGLLCVRCNRPQRDALAGAPWIIFPDLNKETAA